MPWKSIILHQEQSLFDTQLEMESSVVDIEAVVMM